MSSRRGRRLHMEAIEVRDAYWAALNDIVNWTRAHPATPDWFDAYAFATHAISAVERAGGAFNLPKRRALVLDPM
jgi:hypothetical protein